MNKVSLKYLEDFTKYARDFIPRLFYGNVNLAFITSSRPFLVFQEVEGIWLSFLLVLITFCFYTKELLRFSSVG